MINSLKVINTCINLGGLLTGSLSKPVILIDVNNLNNTTMLPSLGKCVEYFKNKGLSASQVTLIKHINSDKAYNGYICKFV